MLPNPSRPYTHYFTRPDRCYICSLYFPSNGTPQGLRASGLGDIKYTGQPVRQGVMDARCITLINDVPMPPMRLLSLLTLMHHLPLALLPSRTPPTNALSTNRGHEVLDCRTRVHTRPSKKLVLRTSSSHDNREADNTRYAPHI